MTKMPADRQQDPRVGKVGFWGTSLGPPPAWERMHREGEAGGYFRIGRSWTHLADEDSGAALRLVGMPTWILYRALLDRVTTAGAFAMGYTVDA